MHTFEQKLSSLQLGMNVQLIHTNGQTFDGIVTENDENDSITIQVSATVTLRYAQIAGFECNQSVYSHTQSVLQAPIAAVASTSSVSSASPQETDSNVEVEDISLICKSRNIKNIFRAMGNTEKNVLKPAYGKLQTAMKNHDEEKLQEAVNICWKEIENNEWEYQNRVNAFLAPICLLCKDYLSAADSFMYANNVKYAYLAAYTGAKEKNDLELYEKAAAYAALYIVENKEQPLKEAASILLTSSKKCNDISGIKYILTTSPTIFSLPDMQSVRQYLEILCGHSISDTHNLEDVISGLEPYYPKHDIEKEIRQWETIPEAEAETEPISQKKEWYQGKLVSYNIFESRGTIEEETGSIYQYELADITDDFLRNKVTKLKTSKELQPIDVLFKSERKMGKDYAISIKCNPNQNYAYAPKKSSSQNFKMNANMLYTAGRYEDALERYQETLDTTQWETVFCQVMNCYAALLKENNGAKYAEKMDVFVAECEEKGFTIPKSYEALQQYYMKKQDYKNAISAINHLIDSCESTEYKRLLNYLLNKARCYRHLQDNQSAIGQFLDWLDIVKQQKLTECDTMRTIIVYPALAEAYFEVGEYENAEKYINLSSGNEERKQILLEKLKKKLQKDEPVSEEITEPESEADESEEMDDDDTTAITLQEAYDAYLDEDGFDSLGIQIEDVVEKIHAFDEKHLYCLLTWLSAISEISKKGGGTDVSTLNPNLTVSQAIQSIEQAFSYAYQNPLAECNYTSTQIITIYEAVQKLIPQDSEKLMTAAILRTFFNPSNSQDYYLDDLICIMEGSALSEKYPMLINLFTEMKSFYEITGCTYAIDAFAGYRSDVSVIDQVVEEANKLCQTIDQRTNVYENQGQVRKLREIMFSDDNSVLKKCLNIAAENNLTEFQFVRNTMEKLFIRNGKPLTMDYADQIKIDAYIDDFWEQAKDLLQNEKKIISRPHDKLKGSRRTNVSSLLKKILACICDWLAVAEHSGNAEEVYFVQKYDDMKPEILTMLKDLQTASNEALKTEGFNWGTYSIVLTAKELISKMEGSYQAKEKKYFFIGFLSGEEILLNDNYLPELQSTFCGWGKMNILQRIERHATEKHISFEERIAQIISQDETKQNFRTAKLLKEYAEDTANESLLASKYFESLTPCLKLVRQRFESVYSDFCNELELFESYGMISDINGEKTAIRKLALDWYKISRITYDFGFYIRMLNFIKNRISVNAAERGKELTRQLEDLADKPEYDFGIYTKEEVTALIEDQNYTSAESILNCIRRHDTNEVYDYTAEPYRYFSEFVSEHFINCRVVTGAGKSVVDLVTESTGKKNLEIALKNLTNNARKETKGGAELLETWPKRRPANQSDLKRFLTRLGFHPCSIQPDENNSDFDSYLVYCQKRRGKVTYAHPIPAFGSLTETEGFRVTCLYGRFNCDSLMNSFRMMNTVQKNTMVLLDFALNMEERRRLARKIKEEKSFSKTFILIDRVVLFYLAKHYAEENIAKRLMAVTLPFSYYQPFVEASNKDMPAELFTGRESELTSIESPDGVNLVYGGRQLGKSALLKMARHHIDKNGNHDRAILLDVQGRNYQEVAELLSKELITEEILDESCVCDNWDDLARHLKKRFMDEDPETRINYLLIMLDEADTFIQTSAENNNPPISAIKNFPAGRFKLVMAGLHNLSRFDREILHKDSTLIHLSSTVIRQFKRPEAIKLLTNTLAYLGFRFNKEVISLILNKTNYYPGLIQFYCQKLLEAMKNEDYAGYDEMTTPYYEISESHFKKVLADSEFIAMVNDKLEASLYTEEEGRSYYHILSLILAYLYYEFPSEKKYTLNDILKVAEEYRVTRLLKLDRAKIEELLYEMWDLNIVSKEDAYYRFATEGFRELLGSKKEVEDGMAEYFEENIE